MHVFNLQSIKKIVKNTVVQSQNLLADQVREILHEGQLVLSEVEKTTKLRAFLFSDILLLTKVQREPRRSRITVSIRQSTLYYCQQTCQRQQTYT